MEHKIRQKIFYLLNSEFDDDLSNFQIEIVDDHQIIDSSVKYFKTSDLGWVYPSKSYVVAICYAKWISEIWGHDFYQILNDPDLLFNNDPYFVPYEKSKKIYDSILDQVGLDFDQNSGIIPDIKNYFLKEFMIDSEQKLEITFYK